MIIYFILNKVNGLGYVGKTIRPFEERWKEHLRADLYIDRAIRKYGERSS